MPRAPAEKPPRFFSRQVLEARRFYHDPRPTTLRDIVVISAGWERCAPEYHIDRTGFPHLCIEYVATGRGRLRLGGREHPLQPGTVFVYGPGVAQDMQSDADCRLSKYFAAFTGRGATGLLRDLGLLPGVVRAVAMGEDVQKAFEDLLRCGQRALAHRPQLTSLYLRALVYTILDAGGAPHVRSLRAYATYRRCRQSMAERFADFATLDDAAAACHVNVSYLCRLFARFAQQSPYAFLQQLRMNHAAALLEGSRLLVREVADVLGMDAFHFSRVFKRVHGMAPSIFAAERSRAGMLGDETSGDGHSTPVTRIRESITIRPAGQNALPSARVPQRNTSMPSSAARAALV